MAAPEFVPTPAVQLVRSYASPPPRAGSWMADRPGEISGRQPVGEQLGTPGPDQGYALTLAKRFAGKLFLGAGESEADALAGAAAIAMKRSGIFGRAPIIGDVTIALTLWGFVDDAADPDLVAIRREWFEEVHLPMHYPLRRRIADAVSEGVLRQPLDEVRKAYERNWRALLDLDVV